MATITKTFRINGALTDMTSVVFSNSVGTMGIIRDDTGAVVVPAGTPLTWVSTGTYQYQLVEPATGLTYTYYIAAVYNGTTYFVDGETFTATAPTTVTTFSGSYVLTNAATTGACPARVNNIVDYMITTI